MSAQDQRGPPTFRDEAAASETDSLLERGQRKAKRLFDGFIDFAFSGNILQIAFGLIIASIFTDLVKSFVGDILMPPLSVILPLKKNIEEKFAILRVGDTYNKTAGYNTLKQAQNDGAVVMAYGLFIYQVVSFFMIGLALYALALLYTSFSSDPIIKHTKKCKYCRQRINEKGHLSLFGAFIAPVGWMVGKNVSDSSPQQVDGQLVAGHLMEGTSHS